MSDMTVRPQRQPHEHDERCEGTWPCNCALNGPNRARVPGHWQAEAEERAKPYAAVVRAWLTGQEGT